MTIRRLLIANRGEISIRIATAAAELGIATVSVFSRDDERSLHVRSSDAAYALHGTGPAAYLDGQQLIEAAKISGCDAVHPGYGFLSENVGFARLCVERGLIFVGPAPELLGLFGDKMQARQLARDCGVPVARGTAGPTSLHDATAFFERLGPGAAIMIKAVAGGGGRGVRPVLARDDLQEAYVRCRSEAKAAFGNGDVYIEEMIMAARHIEIQILGDGTGDIRHLGERDCTLQRRRQKLIEIAPGPTLDASMRQQLIAASVEMARKVSYSNIGTFEFLIDASPQADGGRFVFMEVNPRLQVEHTITEEVYGIDLVKTQIRLADDLSLAELGLDQARLVPVGYAIQMRINMESLRPDGEIMPASGSLTAFDIPAGPGVRVDSFGYPGYVPSGNFDSLLAKLIVHSPSNDYSEVLARARRALRKFRIDGIDTNIQLLLGLLDRPEIRTNDVHTRFVEDRIQELTAVGETPAHDFYFSTSPLLADDDAVPITAKAATAEAPMAEAAREGTIAIPAPLRGSVVAIDVAEGDHVSRDQQVAVLSSMKMEFVVTSTLTGIVRRIEARSGDVVDAGSAILFVEPGDDVPAHVDPQAHDLAPDEVRPDLAAVLARHANVLDPARPDAVTRRHATGQRTARENVDDLCDTGSFVEYGGLAIAAQRRRRSVENLIASTPADGLITGIGIVNGELFGGEAGRCAILAYDYTVLAGTQGHTGHIKTDRIMRIAEQCRLPVVVFAEGGGGRPGDTDRVYAAGLEMMTFANFARSSGLVPRIGIVSGRCFAGNAALLGSCDIIVATDNASIGMGGPAMVEEAGLGTFGPDEIGPTSVQAANGVIDIVVRDEAAAVHEAKRLLSFFQGAVADWSAADQRALRQAVPENRVRAYDMRRIIAGMADEGSMQELREGFGRAMITAFVRIEGQAVGILANNPVHLGGAIDSDAADKASRFMQLCDAFAIPLLSLCDTPGFMVGPHAERQGTVRHVSRMFVTGANLRIPHFAIIIRKGYGLGAMAMTGGSFHSPLFTVTWPTAELGSMGIEGAVRLGFKRELEAIADPAARRIAFDEMVAQAYRDGSGLNAASYFEVDDVIDPAESRKWIVNGLRSAEKFSAISEKRRPFVDTW